MPSERPALVTLLADPDQFFAERTEDASLKGPVVVITLVALLGALAAVVQNQVLVSVFEAAFENASNGSANGTDDGFSDTAIQFFLAITYAVALIVPYIMWLIYAAVFYAISVIFDGEGDFSTTMAVVGWGRAPAIFGSLATLAINYYQFEIRGVDVPETITAENIQRFVREIQSTEIVVLSTTVTVIVTLWSAYLWVYGLKHARNLTRRQAVLTVAVPVLVSLGFTLRNLTTVL